MHHLSRSFNRQIWNSLYSAASLTQRINYHFHFQSISLSLSLSLSPGPQFLLSHSQFYCEIFFFFAWGVSLISWQRIRRIQRTGFSLLWLDGYFQSFSPLLLPPATFVVCRVREDKYAQSFMTLTQRQIVQIKFRVRISLSCKKNFVLCSVEFIEPRANSGKQQFPDRGWSGEELSKLNISSQSKAQCWFRKRKTELKVIEKTKTCIPAMLKPYSASSFCLPNKNRVGVARGDGTNLEVVYSDALPYRRFTRRAAEIDVCRLVAMVIWS